MTAPVIANTPIVTAVILINPVTGNPYRPGSGDTLVSVMPIADPTVGIPVVLLDPTTGVAYKP